MLDYIIVGQGLAGSILSLELIKKGLTVKVIDNNHYRSSSTVAAGLVHPMSFKRTILSWNAESLSTHSIDYYKTKEKELKASFFEPLTFLRLFGSIEEQNNWYSKKNTPPFDKVLLSFSPTLKEYSLINNFGIGKVNWSYRLHLKTFLNATKTHLVENYSLMNEKFDYTSIEHEDEYVKYGKYKAKGIIFCEGHQYVKNPFFNYIKDNSTKGEILKIKVKGVPNYAFSKNCFLLPVDKDEYLLGSTYDWKNKDYEKTKEAKKELLDKFHNISKSKVAVIDHWAGIRPTTRDRKPILGSHPKYNNIHLFNGLGSKGVQLAPYYASLMADYLLGIRELDSEINLSRFRKDYLKRDSDYTF